MYVYIQIWHIYILYDYIYIYLYYTCIYIFILYTCICIYIYTCILVCSTTIVTGDCSWFYAANWEWHPQVASRLGDAIAVISPPWNGASNGTRCLLWRNGQKNPERTQVTSNHWLYIYIYGIWTLKLYIHTYIHAYIHTYMHACMHACIHAYMHTCIHAYMHTCMPYMYVCMHTCIHTCIYIHTYRYVYIQSLGIGVRLR